MRIRFLVLLSAAVGFGPLPPRHATADVGGSDSYTNTMLPGFNLIANHLDRAGNTLALVLLQIDAGSPGEFRTLMLMLMSQALQSLPGPNGTEVLERPQLTGDTLTLRWSGIGPGQSVTVEASSDLADWTVLANPPSDTFQVELPSNQRQPARFFRLRAP